MEKLILKAKIRKITGRKVKTLRKEGLLPANVFGKKTKSQAVSLDSKDFAETFKKAGETALIYLQVEGEKEPERAVLVAALQKHPVSGELLHVDFHQVDLKEKVVAEIPVEVSGESPAEKQGIGTAVQYLDKIEVEALPTDLPEHFMIDISDLAEVEQAIMVKDIKVDKAKVEVKADPEAIVVKVEPPQKEEVAPEPVAEEVAEGAEGQPTEEAKPEGEENKTEETKEEASQ